MAEITKPIKVGNVWTNLISNHTGESVNFEEVTTWWDETPMDDSKADGEVYRKLPTSVGGGYVRRVYDNFGQLFLEKDTMAELRALSNTEVLLLKIGRYRGVTLNGYWAKSDTPAPINYFLFSSDTPAPDDGGEVVWVADIKLKHEFNNVVNILYYGAGRAPNEDVTDNFKAAIEQAPRGREIFIPNRGTGHRYRISSTIEVPDGITIRGSGVTDQIWGLNTSIQYYATDLSPCFRVVGHHVVMENFSINTGASETRQYTGIEVTGGRYSHFNSIYIFRANYGIYIHPTSPGYYSKYERMSCQSCNYGMYIPTGIGPDINATHIISPLLMYNDVGLYIGSGSGGTVDFGAAEIGKNDTKDIELAGGIWALLKSSWGEVSPMGIHVTGGYHIIDGDLRIVNNIVEDGGHIISNATQSYCDTPRASLSGEGNIFWFSFDEQMGRTAYSRFSDATLLINPTYCTWKQEEGQFRTTLEVQSPTSTPSISPPLLTLSNANIDLSQSWTMLIHVKDLISFTNNNVIFSAAKGENHFRIRVRGEFVSTDLNDVTFDPVISIRGGDSSRNRPVWVCLYYDADTQTYGQYSAGGLKVEQGMTSVDLTPFQNADSIVLGKDDWDITAVARTNYLIDEYIMYQRLLSPHEINTITHLTSLPKTPTPAYYNVGTEIDFITPTQEAIMTADIDADTEFTLVNVKNGLRATVHLRNTAAAPSTISFSSGSIISGDPVIPAGGQAILELYCVRSSVRVAILGA